MPAEWFISVSSKPKCADNPQYWCAHDFTTVRCHDGKHTRASFDNASALLKASQLLAEGKYVWLWTSVTQDTDRTPDIKLSPESPLTNEEQP